MSDPRPLILYVDDEWSNRLVFEQSFGERFHVRTLPSGVAALDFLGTQPVAALLTDQRMPEMGGNELLERAKELCPDTIRMVITAYSDLDPILRAVNDGLVARYIIKPWDREELEGILTWAVQAHALGRDSSAVQMRLLESERLATLGTIASAVLHDLAQPVAHMDTDAQRLALLATAAPELAELVARSATLSKDARGKLSDLAVELPEITEATLRGTALMRDLLGTMTRLLRAPTPERPPSADPLVTIRHALAACRSLSIRARARLDYVGPEVLPAVRISDSELTQILINLLVNACQALEQPERRRGKVEVSARIEPLQLELVISDDGPGMEAEVLASIGRPFFSTRPEGSGLGIMQCRRLLERAGGQLTIESQAGTGTTVTCTLQRILR